MPHTMLKAPTPTTPTFLRRGGMMRQYDPAIHKLPIMEKHQPGETGRQLAERLRVEAAVSAQIATNVKGRKPRKAAAKPATE